MKERLVKVAKFLAYPAFYVMCLGLFGYLTFPADKLKDRLIAEFERNASPGQRLEIDKLDTYWFSGVAVTGVKLTMPPEDGPGASIPAGFGGDGGTAAAAPKNQVITIDEGHARVRLLPLLIGRVRIDFWASALGGEVQGTVPVGSSGGDVELEVEKIEVGKIDALAQMAGLPLKGTATGKLVISAVDGKFSKANGALDLNVTDAVVGDGKAKIMGQIELPPAKLGMITVNAEAKEGILKITKFTATGTDLELVADGRISMREPPGDSVADLYVKFKFTDAFRNKSDATRSLLGEAGSTLPSLIELKEPKLKKAKRPDGFFGFHVYGPLKKPKYDPSATDVSFANPPAGASGASKAGARKPPELKKPGMNFPLGPSQAKGGGQDDALTGTPPSTPPPGTPNRAAKPDMPDLRLPSPEAKPPEPKRAEPKPPAEQPIEMHAPEPVPPPPQPEAPPPEQPAPEQPLQEAPQ